MSLLFSSQDAVEQRDDIINGATEDISIIYSPRDTFLVRLTGTNNQLAKIFDDGILARCAFCIMCKKNVEMKS
jgi:hypothetical protein